MNNLGAFFQTYKNKKATEFVLENYRKHYPDSPVTLISDGGSNFNEISEKYKCNYIHSFINLGQPGSQSVKINSDYPVNPRLAFNKEEAFVWLNRFYQACKYSVINNSDYILFLEDDVYIKNKITSLPSYYGFSCGENMDNIINPILIEYLEKKYNMIFNVKYYACCGGAIFNAKVFVEKYYLILNFLDIEYDIIQNLDNRSGWLDLYMHIIYYLIGCKYEVNPQFVETWMNVPWNSEAYSIIHQYKNLY
jgi:hypothetical protein